MSFRTTLVALLLLAGAAGPARAADPVGAFQQKMDDALASVGAAVQAVVAAGVEQDPNSLVDASLSLSNAALAQVDLLTAAASDPVKSALGRKARAVKSALRAFQRTTATALARLGSAALASDVSAKRILALLKSLRGANKSGVKAAGTLAPLGRKSFILTETSTKPAGFHSPGEDVDFKIVPNPFGPACAGPYHVTVTDQFGAPVTEGAHDFDVTTPDLTFPLTMGTAGGGAQVTVTGCGTTSERLLFNYGPLAPGTGPFKITSIALPHGTFSQNFDVYLEDVHATGGIAPCVWTVSGLPAGWQMITSSSGGKIDCGAVSLSGFMDVAGTFQVTVTGTDAKHHVAKKTLSLTIDP